MADITTAKTFTVGEFIERLRTFDPALMLVFTDGYNTFDITSMAFHHVGEDGMILTTLDYNDFLEDDEDDDTPIDRGLPPFKPDDDEE